jgi:hypothetical protein
MTKLIKAQGYSIFIGKQDEAAAFQLVHYAGGFGFWYIIHKH